MCIPCSKVLHSPRYSCIKGGGFRLLVPIKLRGANLWGPESLLHDPVPVPPSSNHVLFSGLCPRAQLSLDLLHGFFQLPMIRPRGFPSWPIYKHGHHAILYLGAMFVSFRRFLLFQVLFESCFSFL